MQDTSLSGYMDGLYGYAMVLSRNPAVAADLVQETYLRITPHVVEMQQRTAFLDRWSANRKLSRNSLVGSDEQRSQRLNQVKSLSPHHRFVIALHSPVKVTETGLRMCGPEKGRQIEAIRSRAVRSLQSALRKKSYEIRASLRLSRQNAGQFLCGLDLLAEQAVWR